MLKAPTLFAQQVEQIAKVPGDTNCGLTSSEIEHALATLNIPDIDAGDIKWRRLHNALVGRINSSDKTNVVYGFILYCFNPANGFSNTERYLSMVDAVNSILMLSGIEVRDDGQLHSVQIAHSLSEVELRTRNLRSKLIARDAHPEVLKYCNKELLVDDYFHTVHEAAKSLCDRVRTMTGLELDGTRLFDKTFSAKDPYLALNALQTELEHNQQNGLKELLNGVMHLVRNSTAHELRIHWDVNEKDAVDVPNLISYIHNLLDCFVIVRRAS